MKKTIISIILGVSLAVAPSAFALTKMSDSNMKSATGQAGVSIGLDDIVIESYTGSTSYTDTDGTDGTATSVVISDKHTVKKYLGMVSDADFQADFLAEAGVAAAGTWVEAAALSIDVGTCSVLSDGISYNNTGFDSATTGVYVSGVVIGLPTILISTTSDTYTVGIDDATDGAQNDGANYIQITKGASAMAILGGHLEIAPH